MFSVSVVIPCYNSQNTIEKSINSVLNQTLTVNEIIVVDDGSSDNSIEIIKKIIDANKTNTSIILYSQKNAGPSVARNKGIELAKSKWIAFLDSDDYWDKNKNYYQIECLKKEPQVVLLGTGSFKKNSFFRITFKMLLFKNYFQTSSTIVKKEILQKYFFNIKQKYSEDFRLWLEISYDHEVGISNQLQAFQVLPLANRNASLSSQLYYMQKGEIGNFRYLYEKKRINFLDFCFACCFSYLKYFKRIIIKFYKK